MRIGLNIDNCIRDFTSALVKTYKDRYPEDNVEKITEWELSKFFPLGKKIYNFIYTTQTKNIFYENAYPYDDVEDGLEELKNLGHTFVYLSRQKPKSKMFTQKWLEYYEFPWNEVYYFDVEENHKEFKSSIDCDIYLEDLPIDLMELQNAGKTVVRRLHPWNENLIEFSGKTVKNFSEFVEFVKIFSMNRAQ